MGKYENGETTKLAIIASAKKLFYANGVKETTFKEIAKDSHVSKESIVYHFKTKESLNASVIKTELDALYREFEKQNNSPKMNLAVSAYYFWYQFFHDENYRKWALAGTDNAEDESWKQAIYELISSAYDLKWSFQSFERKNKMSIALLAPLEYSLYEYVEKHMSEFDDFSEVAEREIILISKMFAIPEEKINLYLIKAHQFAQMIDFEQIKLDVPEF